MIYIKKIHKKQLEKGLQLLSLGIERTLIRHSIKSWQVEFAESKKELVVFMFTDPGKDELEIENIKKKSGLKYTDKYTIEPMRIKKVGG